MKKILLMLSIITVLMLTACGEKIDPPTSISIVGALDRTKVAGEEVELLKYIKANGDNGESYLDEMEVSSQDCTITDGVLTSDVATICTITYDVQVGEVSASETVMIRFMDPYRELENIEEFNNIRMYQIYVAAYQDGTPGGYEIGYGPSSHKGDIQGIINALDYIESLGVNAIWLTPIFESKIADSMNEWEERGLSTGYYADDYYSIDPNFGTEEEFRTLVQEAHNRGLYVFLDGVFGHHGYYDIEGVTDGKSQWYGSEIVYPESLDYFIDVAKYWIEEYEIDGWRMDQSYQLYQDNYNYFRDIRNAVEDLCNERKAEGKEWGTLGYMVAEVFDNYSNIKKYAYDDNAFRSAFNFPVRSTLVGVLAVNDWNQTSTLQELNMVMSANYPDHVNPNLFITNHDVLRLGDLIQMAGKEDTYWERHKLAISFLGAYTGPITLYYGDEYGDEFEGLVSSTGDLSKYGDIAPDNVARSDGQIDGFDTEQQDLINYTKTVMTLRDTYDSLWNGTRENLLTNLSVYADLKTSENNQTLYIMNISSNVQTITLDTTNMDGTTLRNLITDEVITISGDTVTFDVTGLEAQFFIIE